MRQQIEKTEPLIQSYLGLRRTVGTIGLILPFILLAYGISSDGIEPSISHFYYTPMRDFFVGALCVIGLFLMSYRGYQPAKDEWISDRTLGWIAGGGAVVLALIPTTPLDPADCPNGFGANETIHLLGAAIFLIALGVFSFSKFARSDKSTKTYRIMGAVIFACLLTILVAKIFNLDLWPNWLFWLESIAVWAFGISWLVKGETIKVLQTLRELIANRKGSPPARR